MLGGLKGPQRFPDEIGVNPLEGRNKSMKHMIISLLLGRVAVPWSSDVLSRRAGSMCIAGSIADM
jgi:hypothetical protein